LGAHYKIRAEKTGHYYTQGTITGSTRYVWICLHGYGQLGKYFIQKFEFLNPQEHYVVVPEGLNKFYFEGVNDRPVATWMTSEDRLDEIADYILFLESLRHKIGWDKNQNIKIIYFGFSQGSTTLMRWLHDITPRIHYLLLWAGGLPDDLVFDHLRDYFNAIPTHFFIGDQDQYISPDGLLDKISMVEKLGLRLQLEHYTGDHRVDEIVLKKWVEKWLI
jgi:predicted esterase